VNSDGSKIPAEPGPLAFALAEAGLDWRPTLTGFELRAEPAGEQHEELLDGFDRRLQRAGLALTTFRKGSALEARLVESTGGEPREFRARLEREPRFAWDFPPPLDARLAEVLEARALEHLGEHHLTVRPWSVLDGAGKRVAWLELEEHRLGSPTEPPRARRLVLRAVRGYRLEFARIAAALTASGSVATPHSEVDPRAWLSAPPPPRKRVAPSSGQRAFLALGRLVAAQLEILNACEDGVRRRLDDEYLHDHRVALRRLRALVGQLDGVLVEAEHARLVEELRSLARATGPARDLDVLCFDLRLADPALREDLAPAVAALEAERERLQSVLLTSLDQAKQDGTLAHLARAFAPRRPPGELGPRAAKPFHRLLARRFQRRLEQALERTRALDAASPPEALHALRITIKKLRYLLDCARGLVPRADLEAGFATLKGLQSVLGTLQDSAVQEELVVRLATGPAAGAGPRAHLALGRYLQHARQRAEAARARFDALAQLFVSPEGQGPLERVWADLERGTPAS